MKGFWLSEWYSTSCLLPQFKFKNSGILNSVLNSKRPIMVEAPAHQHPTATRDVIPKRKTELKCTELPVECAQKWTLCCTVSCMMSLRNPDKRQRNLEEFRGALVSLGLCNRACWSWVLLYMVISILSGVTSMAFCSAWIPFLRPKYYGCSSVCVDY